MVGALREWLMEGALRELLRIGALQEWLMVWGVCDVSVLCVHDMCACGRARARCVCVCGACMQRVLKLAVVFLI